MEYCQDTSMELLTIFPEGIPTDIMDELIIQISYALFFIHSHGIVHLDVKPTNILIKHKFPFIFKLGDFGQCCKSDGSESFHEGDSRYLTLEASSGNIQDLPKLDMFSLGLTIYRLLRVDELPSSGDEYQALRNGILPNDFIHVKEYRELILDLINPDPSKRLSSIEILTQERFKIRLSSYELNCYYEMEQYRREAVRVKLYDDVM